jgi:hypothetical protein
MHAFHRNAFFVGHKVEDLLNCELQDRFSDRQVWGMPCPAGIRRFLVLVARECSRDLSTLWTSFQRLLLHTLAQGHFKRNVRGESLPRLVRRVELARSFSVARFANNRPLLVLALVGVVR